MNTLRPSCRALSTQFSSRSPILCQLPLRTFTSSSSNAAASPLSARSKEALAKAKQKRKRRKHVQYKLPVLSDIEQYSLVDAMQFIRAFEVGKKLTEPKFDLAIRLKTKKDGPILRNTIRLPHAVKTDIRVCVICDPNSKQARQAKEAGAVLVGEEEVFERIKEGKIDFDRCIATPASLPKIQKAGLPRILGPRGLMPSPKLGTVTDNIVQQVQTMLGGSTYRERRGIIRMAIGQMGFTPEQLRDNVKVFIEQIKKEAAALTEDQGFPKSVFEVVLSSTHSPGFSLNGQFLSEKSIDPKLLRVA